MLISIRHGLVLILGIVLLCACGGSDGADTAADLEPLDFPQPEGLRQIESAHVDLDFAADADAALYISDSHTMELASFYSMQLGDSGWSLRDNRSSEYIATTTLTKDTQIAVVTMVGGRALEAVPDVIEQVSFTPFDVASDIVDGDQVLVYALVATCDVPINDCIAQAIPSIS